MSFRKVVFFGVVVVLGFSVAARAQLSIYGTVSGQRFGGVTCPSYASPCASNDGVVRPYGGTFGVFYDFKDVGPVRLGVDVRGDVLTTNKRADASTGGRGVVREYNVLAGVRGSIKTPIRWLKPYAEIAGGYSRNNTAGVYTFTTTSIAQPPLPPIITTTLAFDPTPMTDYMLVKGMVGVDVAIFPFLDVRAIEFGEGEAFGTALTTRTVAANGSVTNAYGPSSHGVQSIGAGLVFHFGH